jgi:transcriptional regulator GlxA family with amidase domain
MQVLRVCLTQAEVLPTGWLRVLADEHLPSALRLMHEEPFHAWQLTELARAAAMCRATFALRFKEAVGVPPLTYLLSWRMRLAARDLRRTMVTARTPMPHIAGPTSSSTCGRQASA